MRCLYCNKKLSLLKLAKGDSYCSEAHFDAHQLQMSKNAFERLMSLPSENSLKSPLVVKPREEPRVNKVAAETSRIEPHEAPADVEPAAPPDPDAAQQNAALARLTGFTAPPVERPPLKAAPGFQPPPPAPFAAARQLGSPVQPPLNIFWGPEASEPVDPAREMAFPVHEVESTICILNLYLRLSLAEAEPIRWLSARTLIVTPEEFPLEIRRPAAGVLKVEFPELLAEAPEVEESANDPVPVEALEAAPLALVPEVEVDAVRTVEIAVAPEPVEPRLPFLTAPSFQLRCGTNAFVVHKGTSLPQVLSPALPVEIPRLDQGPILLPVSRPAASSTLPALDNAARWMDLVPHVPAAAPFLFPKTGATVRKAPWNPSAQTMMAAPDAANANWPAVPPLDFDPPAPASFFVRPAARLLCASDPQRMLSGAAPLNTNSLFLGTLAVNPLGTQPAFSALPVEAMEFGLRAKQARIQGMAKLPPAWQHRSLHFPLPFPMKIGTRPELEADSHAATGLIPVTPAPGNPAYFSQAPWRSTMGFDTHSPGLWIATNPAVEPIHPDFGAGPAASPILPPATGLSARKMDRGSNSTILAWEPHIPAPFVPALKFLPIRDQVVLPGAQRWQRLGSVPR
jgi:hypothetical protein